MTQHAAFWDKIANKYAARPVADQEAYQTKLKVTQSYFSPQMTVLEFACGTGSTALVHAPLVAQYTAIDISPKMIDIAKSKHAATNISNLTFKVATLDDIETENNAYDAILGHSILHLLENYQEVIAQAYRLLKPGGFFVTNTACLNDHMAYMKYLMPLMRWVGLAPYVKFFSQHDLEQAMQIAGFSLEHQWQPPKSKTAYFLVARK